MTVAIPSPTFWNAPLVLINSSNATIASPIPPVKPRIPSPSVPNPPNNGLIAVNIAEKACLMMSKIANKPLKVDFRLAEAVSLSFKFAVNFRKFSVIS